MGMKIMKRLASMRKRDRKRKPKQPEQRTAEQDDGRWPQDFADNVASHVARHRDTILDGTRFTRDKSEGHTLYERSEIQVGKKLGSGGFSEVHEVDGFVMKPPQCKGVCKQPFRENVRDEKTGQPRFAIKHLKSSLEKDVKTFCRAAADLAVEAHFLSSLSHPNILKIHGWSKGGIDAYAEERKHDGYFLILERLHGTLEDRIESWRQNPPTSEADQLALFTEKTKIASQIASAVAYLHEKRIIFRDLKPENVGFDAGGNVKLFDFGLARELPDGLTDDLDEVFEMSGQVGTFRYMAPECAMELEYNVKADVYSWAMVFYEIMSLTKPFANFRTSEIPELVYDQGQRPRIQPDWPFLTQDLMDRTWAKEIADRPTMKDTCSRLADLTADLDLQMKQSRAIAGLQTEKGEVSLNAPRDPKPLMEQGSNLTAATVASSSSTINVY